MNSLLFLNETLDPPALIHFSDLLEPLLTEYGACNLLAVAIRVSPQDAVCEILASAWRDLSAGQPGVLFISYAVEAKDWCSFASIPERKCYLTAIWQSLSRNEQCAFWRYVQGRAVA
jgi:hypothetical protein